MRVVWGYSPEDVVHVEPSLVELRVRYVVVEEGIEDAWFVVHRERDEGYETEEGWVSVWIEQAVPRTELLRVLELSAPLGRIADSDPEPLVASCERLAVTPFEQDHRQGVLPFPRRRWLRFWDAVRLGNEMRHQVI